VTVAHVRSLAGNQNGARRREVARGVVVEIPERVAGGWQVRTYSPFHWSVYVGKHRAGERRARHRAGRRDAKHRARRWGRW